MLLPCFFKCSSAVLIMFLAMPFFCHSGVTNTFSVALLSPVILQVEVLPIN
ncbi:hypothetical protein D3C73_1529760 [compost metagenome]